MKNDYLIIHLIQEFSSVKVLSWFRIVLIYIINKSSDHFIIKTNFLWTEETSSYKDDVNCSSLWICPGYKWSLCWNKKWCSNSWTYYTSIWRITTMVWSQGRNCSRPCLRSSSRGFQDMGLEVKMPSFLKWNQHSSGESNEARLGTKIRCGVEMHHARLKKFTFAKNFIIGKDRSICQDRHCNDFDHQFFNQVIEIRCSH